MRIWSQKLRAVAGDRYRVTITEFDWRGNRLGDILAGYLAGIYREAGDTDEPAKGDARAQPGWTYTVTLPDGEALGEERDIDAALARFAGRLPGNPWTRDGGNHWRRRD